MPKIKKVKIVSEKIKEIKTIAPLKHTPKLEEEVTDPRFVHARMPRPAPKVTSSSLLQKLDLTEEQNASTLSTPTESTQATRVQERRTNGNVYATGNTNDSSDVYKGSQNTDTHHDHHSFGLSQRDPLQTTSLHDQSPFNRGIAREQHKEDHDTHYHGNSRGYSSGNSGTLPDNDNPKRRRTDMM